MSEESDGISSHLCTWNLEVPSEHGTLGKQTQECGRSCSWSNAGTKNHSSFSQHFTSNLCYRFFFLLAIILGSYRFLGRFEALEASFFKILKSQVSSKSNFNFSSNLKKLYFQIQTQSAVRPGWDLGFDFTETLDSLPPTRGEKEARDIWQTAQSHPNWATVIWNCYFPSNHRYPNAGALAHGVG